MVAFDNGWWEFGSTERIEAQGDYGGDFDPAGSFSTLMLVEAIDLRRNLPHGLMGKCLFGLGQPGGWDVEYIGDTAGATPGAALFNVGKVNSLGTLVSVNTPGPMAVGRKVLIACMYTWAGDGTSIQRVVTYDAVNGKLFAQRVDGEAVGDNNINLYMGATQRHPSAAVKVYWSGFYKGTVFTDQDVEDVWNKIKHPIDDFNPTVLNYFCQDVGSTYTADVANGPNAPYVFDISGTPTAGGICTASDTSILGHQFGIQLPSSNILGHQFTVLKKLKRYRSLSFRDRITFKRTI